MDFVLQHYGLFWGLDLLVLSYGNNLQIVAWNILQICQLRMPSFDVLHCQVLSQFPCDTLLDFSRLLVTILSNDRLAGFFFTKNRWFESEWSFRICNMRIRDFSLQFCPAILHVSKSILDLIARYWFLYIQKSFCQEALVCYLQTWF